MRNVIKALGKEIALMNQDIEFIKVVSVYGYVIFSASAMLVGLVIGLNN
jgi:hypothetical protein